LKISAKSVLAASTGVIGEFLPVGKITEALPSLKKIISENDENLP
jgi:N-acetylglutamate synthase/N-acetylornithine aminotransferase